MAFQGILLGERDDRRALPWLQPVVARHRRVVLVGLAVAAAPAMELPAGKTQPAEEPECRQLGEQGQSLEEVHHFVAQIVRHPSAV